MGLECCRDTAKIIVQNLGRKHKIIPKSQITKKILKLVHLIDV